MRRFWGVALAAAVILISVATDVSAGCEEVGQRCWRGGGNPTRDCQLEIGLPNLHTRSRSSSRVVCRDGDPACDADRQTNNGSCRILVSLCINNHDPNLPQCSPSDVNSFKIDLPRPDEDDPSEDFSNLLLLGSNAGALGFGLNVFDYTGAVSSGGSNADSDACRSVYLTVPMRENGASRFVSGVRHFRIRTVSSTGAVDEDRFTLACRASHCGNGRVDDSEECDDGNHNNRDGCDNSCHLPPTPTETRTPVATRTPTPTDGPSFTPTTSPGYSSACGNSTVDAGEECDNGGYCVGGSNAGDTCVSEGDCLGNGACDGGNKIGTRCNTDSQCPGSRCLHCKPVGGDGCAANCTNERQVAFNFVPGNASGVTIDPGTSGTTVYGPFLNIPLSLTGGQVLTVGQERYGRIPVVVRTADFHNPAIPILSIACACVRPATYKTCGGTLFEPDGTLSANCTTDFDGAVSCPASLKCAPIHGPGNTASGVIGCDGLTPIDADVIQDCNGAFEEPPYPPQQSFQNSGGRGAALINESLAIGTVIGTCFEPYFEYGPDGRFCTDDDDFYARGEAHPFVTTTGAASGVVYNPADFPGDINGPWSVIGQPFSCRALADDSVSGVQLVGAFTSCDQPTVGDIVATFQFAAE